MEKIITLIHNLIFDNETLEKLALDNDYEWSNPHDVQRFLDDSMRISHGDTVAVIEIQLSLAEFHARFPEIKQE